MFYMIFFKILSKIKKKKKIEIKNYFSQNIKN